MNELTSMFNDIEELSKFLTSTIAGNSRYDQELLDIVKLKTTINENGETIKEFNRPLNDPVIADKIQSLIFSLFKNRLTKQKIKGGSLVQVSNTGYTDQLNIRFKDENNNEILNKNEFSKKYNIFDNELDQKYQEYIDSYPNKSIAYYECYMP